MLTRTRSLSRGPTRNGFTFPLSSLQLQNWELKCFASGWLESALSFWKPLVSRNHCHSLPHGFLSIRPEMSLYSKSASKTASHLTESRKWRPIMFARVCGLKEVSSIHTQGHEHQETGIMSSLESIRTIGAGLTSCSMCFTSELITLAEAFKNKLLESC